jgi:hypothetical protein
MFFKLEVAFDNQPIKCEAKSAIISVGCRTMEKLLSYSLLLVLTCGAVTFLASIQRFHDSNLAYQICELSFGLCNSDLMMATITAGAAGLFFLLKS